MGVARHTVWKIWRERDDCVQFKVLGVSEGECPSVNPSHYKSILEDYFQVNELLRFYTFSVSLIERYFTNCKDSVFF